MKHAVRLFLCAITALAAGVSPALGQQLHDAQGADSAQAGLKAAPPGPDPTGGRSDRGHGRSHSYAKEAKREAKAEKKAAKAEAKAESKMSKHMAKKEEPERTAK